MSVVFCVVLGNNNLSVGYVNGARYMRNVLESCASKIFAPAQENS